MAIADFWRTSHHDGKISTPTKRQVLERQVSKRPDAKHLKRQVYKTSDLQNVRSSKRPVSKHPY